MNVWGITPRWSAFSKAVSEMDPFKGSSKLTTTTQTLGDAIVKGPNTDLLA